jgi:hypothetical protein
LRGGLAGKVRPLSGFLKNDYLLRRKVRLPKMTVFSAGAIQPAFEASPGFIENNYQF